MDIHRKVSELLALYLTGKATPEEKEEIEKHLAECDRCKLELEEIRWLSKGVRRYVRPTEHVSSEKLVVFSENPKELTEQQVQMINEHLEICDSCSKELSILKGVAKCEVPDAPTHEPGHVFIKPKMSLPRRLRGQLGRIWPKITWLVAKPAFAYVLVLLLAYPAYRGLQEFGFLPGERVPRVIDSRSFWLAERLETKRTPGSRNLVEIQKETELVILNFYIPIYGCPNCRYDLELRIGCPSASVKDMNDYVVWSAQDYKGFDDEGNFSLSIEAESLITGPYNIEAIQINPEDASKRQTYTFFFEVIVQDEVRSLSP